ncbi:MAG: helix-turn-helix domain-containing protein [Burkholderiaceae bacterium]
MNEEDLPADAVDSPAAGVADEPPSSFGARLAAARETAGLGVGEMAGRLRLHVNQVRALEAEDLAKLPETAYVRGFVRSYARSLGLDPAPLIEDLNSKVGRPANSVVDGLARTPDYSPVRAAAHEHASRSLVLGLAVIALIALGGIGWYATRPRAPEPVAAAPATPAAASTTAAVPTEQPAAAPSSAPADSADPPAVATEPAPAPSQPLPGAASLLTLSFNGVSWVDVTDANGKVLLSQLAREGDVLQPAEGVLPLTVVIGDASKATVSVRGQALNMEPLVRSNVARFTVK